MKSYKTILVICLIIILFFIAIYTIFYFNANKVNKLLEDEDNQVIVLSDIYQDFISGFNTENINIVLDNSALKNILTDNEYSEDNIMKLKNIEKTYEGSQVTYTLSTQYTSSTQILTVKIDRTGYNHNMNAIQKYKLYYKDGKVVYERYGSGITLQE